jgi:hypothetical protein
MNEGRPGGRSVIIALIVIALVIIALIVIALVIIALVIIALIVIALVIIALVIIALIVIALIVLRYLNLGSGDEAITIKVASGHDAVRTTLSKSGLQFGNRQLAIAICID